MGALTAFGLGLLTVIHPCPLSTNISAVTLLLALQHKFHKKILIATVFVFGETLTFTAIGIVLAFGGFNIPVIANFLQSVTRELLGPILIIVGMMLSGILLKNQQTIKLADRFASRNARFGVTGGAILGILVALSFCPMSAALFFGVLIPLAISKQAVVWYPVLFSIGSVLPLLAIIIIATRSESVFRKSTLMRKIQKYYSQIIGSILILSGIYFSLHIFLNLYEP